MTHEKLNIQPLLNDYVMWFSKIVEYTFYPNRPRVKPDCLLLSGELESQFNTDAYVVDSETLKQIHVLRTVLLNQADVLMNACDKKKAPSHDNYTYFKDLFAELYARINRLSNDSVVEGFGVDVLTGLRNEKTMIADLDVEIQKTGRNPYKFCAALIRINDLENSSVIQNKTLLDVMLKALSHIFQESIRPYDEIYRLKGNTFLLCLKYTDKLGALNLMERVKESLEEKRLCFEENSKEGCITLSSCVMEPTPKDTGESVLSHLRQSLELMIENGGGIFEYQELSPLEKFVSKENEVSES